MAPINKDRNKVRKANLMLMVEKLHIPLEYQPQMELSLIHI